MDTDIIHGQCTACTALAYGRDEVCVVCGEQAVHLYPLSSPTFRDAMRSVRWTLYAAVSCLGAALIPLLTAIIVFDVRNMPELGGETVIPTMVPLAFFVFRFHVTRAKGRASGRVWAVIGAILCVGVAYLYLVQSFITAFALVMSSDCSRCQAAIQYRVEFFGLLLGTLLLGFAAISGIAAAATKR